MIKTEEWGLIDYEAALGRQTTLYNEAIATKLAGGRCDETVITCQHNHVYTLGKSGKDSNMLLSTQRLASLGVQLYHIKRGGDITYHGPGQIVMYPIIDLEQHHIGLKDYVWRLEESVITTAGDYGITCATTEEASLTRQIIRSAKKCVVLTDSSKLGKRGFARICQMENVDILITDDGLPENARARLEELGVRLIIA